MTDDEKQIKEEAGKRAAIKSYCSDPDKLAEGFLLKYIFDPEPDSAELPLKTVCYTLTRWKQEFYFWPDGCWYRLSDDEMSMRTTAYLQVLNANSQDEQISISVHRVNDIILNLKGRCGRSEETKLNSWPDGREKLIYTLACRNGLVCWDRKEKIKPVLVKHTPKFFNVSKLPYDYDPDAKCDLWLSFLKDVMLGRQEYIDVLQQFAGYLLRPDLLEQKFLLGYGGGGNGKSVFCEVMQAFVGENNCSQIGLKHFGDKFALYGTLGKLVNITTESSHIIEDESENALKSFVSGDTQSFQRKFKDPISATPTAKIIIMTNALPKFRDKTVAVWRRIILIPFDKTIPPESQERGLAGILKKELSGILNWALEGLQKLNENGFVLPESHAETIETYRKDADPARAFLTDNYTESDNGEYVECKDLYARYCQFCNENGFEPSSSQTFGHSVRRCFPAVKHNQGGTGTMRTWRYSGIMRVLE